jgi:hypothetical protein
MIGSKSDDSQSSFYQWYWGPLRALKIEDE